MYKNCVEFRYLLYDEIVKSKFSPPQAGGEQGEGEITYRNTATYHPHPNPPPCLRRGLGRQASKASGSESLWLGEGRRFSTFYETILHDIVKSYYHTPCVKRV